MRTKLFSFFLFFPLILLAQQKDFQIEWDNQKQIGNAHWSKIVPGFDDKHFQYDAANGSIQFVALWDVQNSGQSFELEQVVYEPVMAEVLKNIDLNSIPGELEYTITTTKARNEAKAVLSLNPLIKEGGQFKRVVSFKVTNSKFSSANQVENFNTDLTNSVLATGEWYRFYIEETGVYKITRSFLNDLGFDVDAIDPGKLKIYGHGGQALPLVNEENQYYDLPQTSIKVVGEEDGSFDAEDYILFYGTSTKGFSQENNSHINPYADRSYYYITANGEDGERIYPAAQPQGAAETTITQFDDYKFYETDQYNIAKMGRRWFGDVFSVQNEQTYSFTFENLVTGEPIKVSVYAAAVSQINTSMQVKVNGQPVGTLSFGGIGAAVFGDPASLVTEIPVSSDNINVTLDYSSNGNPASQAYLDYIRIAATRLLQMEGSQLAFTYEEAAFQAGIGEYVLQNAAAVPEVWDVTDFTSIAAYGNPGGNEIFTFKVNLGEQRKYVALLPSDYYTPQMESNPQVANQNLKGIFFNSQNVFEDIDYLIITSKELLPQAERLAAHRILLDGLNVKVVDVAKIYTEFSSGKQDISAIRNFIKYVYDNASSAEKKLKYIGLFGDASVDYKDRLENNNNVVPTFEAYDGFLLSSIVTDDFYGFMDPEEGTTGNSDLLDIAIGRILADTPQRAREIVDKIIAYDSKVAYGPWRNDVFVVSDDAKNTFEFQRIIINTEILASTIASQKPALNVFKIYADAYQQQSSSGGDRYPEVNEAINDAVEKGALVINYFGHGGESGLAHERLVTQPDILSWTNTEKFPVFVVVSCEFTKFDNPLHVSAGELVVTNPLGGAVGMISTTRTIGFDPARELNNTLASYLFNYSGGPEISVAEALRKTKNVVTDYDRRIMLFFGDPAMKLAIPEPRVILTEINDHPIATATDTLKALSHVKIAGQVVSPNGNLLSNYNGTLAATIFDKLIERQTLGNDNVINPATGELAVLDFNTLGEIVFRGQASVTNGTFEFDFVVPKDISMPVGEGRISFYSEENNELIDQKGYNNNILIGGLNENAPEDNEGPEILLYMNDENFAPGGTTNSAPVILAKLADENGINTASGIGHDIVAYIDGDETNPYILNDYYETEIDDFTRGTASYKLRDLEPGLHTLTLKAWDVYNNSSTEEITFYVAGDDKLAITRVLNYPNPFHDYTEFWFNHNRPYEPLEVQVQVFTVTGKVVWTQNRIITTNGFLSREISWDGKDDFGDAIGKGVYVYKLTVKSTVTNQKVEKFEKLVIL